MALVFRSHIIHTSCHQLPYIFSQRKSFSISDGNSRNVTEYVTEEPEHKEWSDSPSMQSNFCVFRIEISLPSFDFHFLASTSEILGGPDIYKQFGDMINLTCVIKGTAAPPETIYWYHRGKVRYRNHLYSNTYIPLMYQFYLGNKLLFQSRWSRRCQYNKWQRRNHCEPTANKRCK